MLKYDKHKRANGSYKTQLRCVEGYREKGKIKQRTIKNFGYVEDAEDQELFIKEAKDFDEKFKKDKKMLRKNKRPRFNETKFNEKFNYGYKFLSSVYDSLNLEKFFDNIDFKGDYSLNEILKFFVIQRILDPSSKRRTTQSLQKLYNSNFDFTLADVYRSLDKYSDHLVDIQQYLNDKIKSLFGRDFDNAYYDVTNYFCEIDFPDLPGELRQRGVSKEHRTDPIIQLGLFIDENSIPVCMSIFPGNTSDSLTFQPTMNQIKENFSFKKVVAVADKGMNSGTNIDYLINNGNGFLFGQALKGTKGKRYHKQMFEENDYHYNATKTFKYKTFIENYYGIDNKGKKVERKRNVLICWNENDAIMEKKKRLDKIKRAEKSIENNAYTLPRGATEYILNTHVTKDGELANKTIKSINFEKIENDERFDGYFAIITSELDYDYKKMMEVYGNLWRIEESFKITKSEFKTRPIYVRTKKHIEGHFLICFVALLILRMLQKEMNFKLSARRIIEALNTSQCIINDKNSIKVLKNDTLLNYEEKSLKLTDENLIIEDFIEILKAFNAEIPYAEYTIGDFNNYLKTIKFK